MSNVIMSLGLANRMQVLFRSNIHRLSVCSNNAGTRNQLSSCSSSHSLIVALNHQQNAIKRQDNNLKFNPIASVVNNLQARSIYSEICLGMHKLEQSRERRSELIGDGRERFFARISKSIQDGDFDAVIQEDLINLIALAENEEHIELIEKLAMQNSSTQVFSSWGPQVMRLYYKMNLTDRAYNNIKDDRFGNFFHQITSFSVVMTMLFNAGRYNDVIEIYNLSRDKLAIDDTKFPTNRSITLTVFAAYAKINTPESFAAAEKLFMEDPSNPRSSVRVAAFVAYLAANHGKPSVAVNLISKTDGQNHILLKNLKIVCLVKMKRFDDIVYMLRSAIGIAASNPDSKLLFKDVYELLKGAQEEIEDQGVRDLLVSQMTEIEHKNLIQGDVLDSGIFREVVGSIRPSGSPPRFNRDRAERPPRRVSPRMKVI